jgi:hypothetical protein
LACVIAVCAIVGAIAAAATPVGASGGPSIGVEASRCSALPAPSDLRSQLIAAYRRVAQLPSSIGLVFHERVRYGRCGTTRWAFGLPVPSRGQRLTEREQITIQDHSPIFKRSPGRVWLNLGIGPLCGAGALPAAMAHAWHMACQ